MHDFLYHDDALIALAKPAGRIVIPGRGAAAAELTLRDEVAGVLGRPVFVVHRLDRGTSGVLLFAITPEAHRALSMAFERHEVDKRYWGLCRGTLLGAGEIDRALVPIRGGKVRPARPGEAAGKPSVTGWRALERFGGGRGREASPPSSSARAPAACTRCARTSRCSVTRWPSTPTTAAPSACAPADLGSQPAVAPRRPLRAPAPPTTSCWIGSPCTPNGCGFATPATGGRSRSSRRCRPIWRGWWPCCDADRRRADPGRTRAAVPYTARSPKWPHRPK